MRCISTTAMNLTGLVYKCLVGATSKVQVGSIPGCNRTTIPGDSHSRMMAIPCLVSTYQVFVYVFAYRVPRVWGGVANQNMSDDTQRRRRSIRRLFPPYFSRAWESSRRGKVYIQPTAAIFCKFRVPPPPQLSRLAFSGARGRCHSTECLPRFASVYLVSSFRRVHWQDLYMWRLLAMSEAFGRCGLLVGNAKL